MKAQNTLTFFLSTTTYIIAVFCLYALLVAREVIPHTISTLDLILIILATLRLTELIVYDKIFEFVRDLFKGDRKGIKKTAEDLISCPWCVSVWVATVILFVYFLIPNSWIFITILAVSGIASIIQLATNSLK